MRKVYTVFEITKNGKLKDLKSDRYSTEEECFNQDIKGMFCGGGEYVILPIYI
jgi:hypothetical protein